MNFPPCPEKWEPIDPATVATFTDFVMSCHINPELTPKAMVYRAYGYEQWLIAHYGRDWNTECLVLSSSFQHYRLRARIVAEAGGSEIAFCEGKMIVHAERHRRGSFLSTVIRGYHGVVCEETETERLVWFKCNIAWGSHYLAWVPKTDETLVDVGIHGVDCDINDLISQKTSYRLGIPQGGFITIDDEDPDTIWYVLKAYPAREDFCETVSLVLAKKSKAGKLSKVAGSPVVERVLNSNFVKLLKKP